MYVFIVFICLFLFCKLSTSINNIPLNASRQRYLIFNISVIYFYIFYKVILTQHFMYFNIFHYFYYAFCIYFLYSIVLINISAFLIFLFLLNTKKNLKFYSSDSFKFIILLIPLFLELHKLLI